MPVELAKTACPICGTHLVDHHEWPKEMLKCHHCGYARLKPDTPRNWKPKKRH